MAAKQKLHKSISKLQDNRVSSTSRHERLTPEFPVCLLPAQRQPSLEGKVP